MIVPDYKDLIVWQKSIDLVVEVYRLVKKLPREETYALSDQMRRAVVSIPSKIAAGHTCYPESDCVETLSVANGSKAAIETQLLICLRLNYLDESDAERALSLCTEIGKMLSAMISKLSYKLSADS